jgi:hypothetical protein
MGREQCVAFLAIDWADAKHAICLLEAPPRQQEPVVLKHTPEDLEAWATALRTRFGGQKIAVGLGQSRGPLLYARLRYALLVLYPIHPATLAKYRQAFAPSRAKDDPQDADYLLELLPQHRDRLQAWRPDHAKTRTLQYPVEPRRRLVNDRPRISNRLTALLQASFPQV